MDITSNTTLLNREKKKHRCQTAKLHKTFRIPADSKLGKVITFPKSTLNVCEDQKKKKDKKNNLHPVIVGFTV